MTRRYLNAAELAELAGLKPGTLSRYRLPDPDVIVGPVNDDGTLPRGTVRGWSRATADAWVAGRRTNTRHHRHT